MRKPRHIAYILIGILLVILFYFIVNRQRSAAPLPTPAPTLQATATPTVMPTTSPSIEPTASPAPKKATDFELPVQGASGYASTPMTLRASPDAASGAVASLGAGTPFQILSESGGWFHVQTARDQGWLSSRYCLINLPDIVPSIVYDATNTYRSIIRSSGVALPGITGTGLYPGKQENERLGESQFIMPVLYPMAKKIFIAQQMALKNGETLVIYEAYRPYDVQMTIVRALSKLASRNAAVMAGISAAPWTLSWFASTKLSNHQRGGAIDVSLARVVKSEPAVSGGYGYTRVTEAKRYEMPTPMHELSEASAAFSAPVNSNSRSAWRQAAPASAMNDAALRLQSYCTKAGLTPLASEWWHFNDLDALELSSGNPSSGRYTLSSCVSVPPEV